MPRLQTVIFVHGCFWHSHAGCRYASTPGTHSDYWLPKLTRNVSRDKEVISELTAQGWRVLVVWECATKHVSDRSNLPALLAEWISGSSTYGEIPKTPHYQRLH